MLFISKHSRAPSSDDLSRRLIRSSRSLRSRSKSTRASQSTPIRPYVLIAIFFSFLIDKAQLQRDIKDEGRDGGQRWGQRWGGGGGGGGGVGGGGGGGVKPHLYMWGRGLPPPWKRPPALETPPPP